MVGIEVITGRATFEGLLDEWNDVLAASGLDEVLLAHGWLRVWANSLGRDRQLQILR